MQRIYIVAVAEWFANCAVRHEIVTSDFVVTLTQSHIIHIHSKSRKKIFFFKSAGLVWFGLCCLMTPGLSKDIRCHV